MNHPNPLASPVRNVEMENQIGWFDLAFKEDPDHWYTFAVYNNGLIVPTIARADDLEPLNLLTFFHYLADKNLCMVKFTQYEENAIPDCSKQRTKLPNTMTADALTKLFRLLNPKATMRD